MAQTWKHAPVLTKIKIGETTYWVKDNDARAILDTYTSLPTYSPAASINATGNAVPTAAMVKEYVDNATTAIHNFDVQIYTELPAASAQTMYILALIADSHSTGDVYDEFITVKSGSAEPYTYTWEKIGNTDIDLSGYVQKTTTIAGIDLQDNITADELKTALGLGALAYKSSAKGSYQPAGTVELTTTSTAVASTGMYTPTGTISIDFAQTATTATLTKADYTPEGNVSLGEFTQTATAATLTKGDYTPAGTVSVSLSGNSFSVIDSVGTAPTFSEGAFTAATITYSGDTFAKEGVVATVGSGEEDGETLILTSATTGSATNITAFNGGSKAADTFTAGSVPTTKSVTVGVEAATFTGTTATNALVIGVEYDKATANGATFTGTTATNALVTGVEYDKASSNGATFYGTETSVNVSGTYDKATGAAFTGTTATITVE